MKTQATKAKQIQRKWHLIDAQGKILGRLSTQIAQLLMGKNNINYVPYLDCGDWVVVINAKEIKVTGKKASQKKYYRYSGYPGGLKALTFKQVMARDPRRVIAQAVAGMLPKNKLKQQMLKRLRIFINNVHPYEKKFQS